MENMRENIKLEGKNPSNMSSKKKNRKEEITKEYIR